MLRGNIKPNYVHFITKKKNKSLAARRTIETAEKLWVKQEIKKLGLYKKKDFRNNLVYRKYLDFANHSYPAIF